MMKRVTSRSVMDQLVPDLGRRRDIDIGGHAGPELISFQVSHPRLARIISREEGLP
jgi:hypothetical protein